MRQNHGAYRTSRGGTWRTGLHNQHLTKVMSPVIGCRCLRSVGYEVRQLGRHSQSLLTILLSARIWHSRYFDYPCVCVCVSVCPQDNLRTR